MPNTIVLAGAVAGSAVLLCTPTPMSRRYVYSGIGAYAESGNINFMVRRYAEVVRSLAKEMQAPLVDALALFADRRAGWG